MKVVNINFGVILFALVVIAECSAEGHGTNEQIGEGYDPEGDHYWGSPQQLYQNPGLAWQTAFKEYEDLYQNQDAAAITNKMIDDVLFIHWEKGRLRGKEAVEKAYKEWFAAGKASLRYEVIDCDYCNGKLREGYIYGLFKAHYFDKNNVNIENTIARMICKEVPGGFELDTWIEVKDTEIIKCKQRKGDF